MTRAQTPRTLRYRAALTAIYLREVEGLARDEVIVEIRRRFPHLKLRGIDDCRDCRDKRDTVSRNGDGRDR